MQPESLEQKNFVQKPKFQKAILFLNIILVIFTFACFILADEWTYSDGWFDWRGILILVLIYPPFNLVSLSFITGWIIYITFLFKKRSTTTVSLILLTFTTLAAIYFASSLYTRVIKPVGLSSIPRFAPGYSDPDRVDIGLPLRDDPLEEFGMFGNNLFEYKNRIYLWSWDFGCSIQTFLDGQGKCPPESFQTNISLGYFDQNLNIKELGDKIWSKLDIQKYKTVFNGLPFSPFISRIGDGYYVGHEGTAYIGNLEGGLYKSLPIKNDHYSNQNVYIYNNMVYTLEETFNSDYSVNESAIRETSFDGKKNTIISKPRSPHCYIDRIISNEKGLIQVEASKVQGVLTNCYSYIILKAENVTETILKVEEAPSVNQKNDTADTKINPNIAKILEISDKGIDTITLGITSVITFDFIIDYRQGGFYLLEATAISPNGKSINLTMDYYNDAIGAYGANLLLDLENFGAENVSNGSYVLKDIKLYKKGDGYDRGVMADHYLHTSGGQYSSKKYIVK